MSSQFYADYPVSGGGVTSLNGLTGNLTLVGAGGITITPNSPIPGDILITGTGGTVTSIAFADGSNTPIFTISGSPVTTSGTITETLVTQSANSVFAGPTSGGAAQPTFRALVAADIPSLSSLYANIHLSNLSSTAVNTSILPDTAAAYNFGNNSLPWFAAFSTKFTLVDSSVVTRASIQTNTTLVTGNGNSLGNPGLTLVTIGVSNVDVAMQSANNAAGNLWLGTGNGAATGNSGNVTIYSGNGGGTSGNSGNIILTPSTVTSGTRGKIQFQDGSEGTSGQVWTSTTTTGSGAWAAPTAVPVNNKELFTLSGGDITNQFIDLAHVAKTNSINFVVQGAGSQIEGVSFDYSVNYTGGAGGNTRITFLNGLATGGLSALVAGDVVVAQYMF